MTLLVLTSSRMTIITKRGQGLFFLTLLFHFVARFTLNLVCTAEISILFPVSFPSLKKQRRGYQAQLYNMAACELC